MLRSVRVEDELDKIVHPELVGQGAWSKYTSTDKNFSILYPPNWKLIGENSSEAEYIYFSLKNSSIEHSDSLQIGITIIPNDSGKNVYDWYKDMLKMTESQLHPAFLRALDSVGGEDAREVEGIVEFQRSNQAAVMFQGKKYYFWVQPFENEGRWSVFKSDLDIIFHQMLFSVQFEK
ncbi:MAG: hypothetical protein GW947_04100 [Candidatus Pacebacteria bacterium]|nr:hypothetical protein [Candidatus Paceibacterota bacterium]PIR61151.1 MAG: hypothetical protein COU68_00895 [Candidatus Pacebacteria bacterium CG10_big_fil_rev_8_21_14_0_10_45_6]